MTRKMRRDSIYRSEELSMREANGKRTTDKSAKISPKSIGQPPYDRRIITEGRVEILGGQQGNWRGQSMES